ncbi:hypothetical protein FOQG_17014, partial [Fusarium oxysporum f. sp. raphani 54005]
MSSIYVSMGLTSHWDVVIPGATSFLDPVGLLR